MNWFLLRGRGFRFPMCRVSLARESRQATHPLALRVVSTSPERLPGPRSSLGETLHHFTAAFGTCGDRSFQFLIRCPRLQALDQFR